MTHKVYEEKFFLWHDGELPESQKRDFEVHLQHCSDCAALEKKWKQTAAAFATPAEQINNSDFVNRVMRRLPQQEPVISFWRWPAFGFGFATLVLLVTFKLRPEPVTLDSLLWGSAESATLPAVELIGINVEE